MKCVCPMGGDRVCPDDCPLAAWAGLPPQDRKAQRKPIAERLYKDGFTMEQIATQLGVSKKTISLDLIDIVTEGNNVKDRGTDTRGRKKSSGRPKGRKPEYHETIVDLADRGLSSKEIADEVGIGPRMVDRVLEVGQVRRDGTDDPEIERAALSLTAQQKLDIAIRQHKKKLDIEYQMRVQAEVKRLLDEMTLPAYARELADLERKIRDRKGIMDRATYRKILGCLHVERLIQLLNIPLASLDADTKKRYDDAFMLFTELEKRVLNEKDSPTPFRDMPKTYEDLMRMKAKVKADRAAKRAAKANINVR